MLRIFQDMLALGGQTVSFLIIEQGLSNSVPKIPQSIQPLTRPDLVQAGAVSNGSPLDHSDSIL